MKGCKKVEIKIWDTVERTLYWKKNHEHHKTLKHYTQHKHAPP